MGIHDTIELARKAFEHNVIKTVLSRAMLDGSGPRVAIPMVYSVNLDEADWYALT